jgi:beta-fructofuranosidase
VSTALTNDLDSLRKEKEASAQHGRFSQAFHLMPPVGWLNDPNGLSQFKGLYHAYFQYAPFNINGGVKMWGLYTSENLLDWEYQGVPLFPDQPFDVSGVYSGSALVEGDKLHIFYTGNVKRLDSGQYDYIHTGREANTVHCVSADGRSFPVKRCVMTNADYPEDDTCHVRDPKVWKDDKGWWMVQGARKNNDTGEILLFHAQDPDHWELFRRLTTDEPFGFMWECPDYFVLQEGDSAKQVLSFSPQGLHGGKWDERNVYASGFCMLTGSIEEVDSPIEFSDFSIWDGGFDFYAPQSFLADDGRRILIGWMGIGDTPTQTNKTIADGWQHCFTLPRELYLKDGAVCQRPVRELEQKRGAYHTSDAGHLKLQGIPCFDALITPQGKPFTVMLADQFTINWDTNTLSLEFDNTDKEGAGAGRTKRSEVVSDLEELHIVADYSSVEIFIKDSSLSFTTRYYPDQYWVDFVGDPTSVLKLWELNCTQPQ